MKIVYLRIQEVRNGVFRIEYKSLFGWKPYEMSCYDYPITYFSLKDAEPYFRRAIREREFTPKTHIRGSALVR
jgi:hypothetical protein